MSTIRRVASEACTSIATVSRVLNSTGPVGEKTRRRVLEAAAKLGYEGEVRRTPAKMIALAYTGRFSIASPYDVAVLDGMSLAAPETGCDMTIVRLQIERRTSESYARILRRKGAKGAIVRTTAETRDICRELAREEFPCVVIGDAFEGEPVNSIHSESRSTSYQAVEHLISLGHRRIAMATSHIPDHDHAERQAGYEQALRDHGITPDPKLVFPVWALRPNGAQVLQSVMSLTDRPTALFIADPLVAVGAINQAHAMGVKIPKDISIVGFDDTDVLKNVFPRVTAICQDAKQLGYDAMLALSQMLIDGTTGPFKKVIPTWLELNDTTGPAPARSVRTLPDGTRLHSTPASVDGEGSWAPG